jgi:excisionase family DNA binding protein
VKGILQFCALISAFVRDVPREPKLLRPASDRYEVSASPTYDLPPVLSPDETARFLGVDRKTVYEAIASGDLPARRVGKRRIVILRDVLLHWLGQGRVQPSEDR